MTTTTETTYTVRPLGQTSWADGITDLDTAREKAAEARGRGLKQVVIVDDSTGEIVE